MRIAFLGWGSLIWKPGSLRIQGEWREDGPFIPIEFARISSDGRLTLVICPGSVCPSAREVAALWAHAKDTTLESAIETLRERENVPRSRVDRIGFVLGLDDGKNSRILTHKQTEHVQKWARQKALDALVWTDLPSNWDDPPAEYRDRVRQPLNEDNVVAYLRRLSGESLFEAEEYIRFAPEQVQTTIRRKVEKEFGWGFIASEARPDFRPRGIPSTGNPP